MFPLQAWLKKALVGPPCPVHVVYAADKNFLLPLTISVYSLLENFQSRERALVLTIFVCEGFGDVEKNTLLKAIRPVHAENMEVRFVRPDMRSLSGLTGSLHFTSIIWARLLISETLRGETEKAVYVDADTLVRADVAELFDVEMGDRPLFAAPDWTGGFLHPLHGMPANSGKWNIPEGAEYFNAGVQLVNVATWNSHGLKDEFVRFLRENPDLLFLGDQNAMNVFFHGRIGALDPKWNKQFVYKKVRDGSWPMKYEIHDWDPPKIIHFVSEEKPWLPGCEVQEKDLYLEYWKKTELPFTHV